MSTYCTRDEEHHLPPPPLLLTLRLKESLSSKVIVSALAITGTMLTQLCSRFMNSTSRGFRLGVEGAEREKERERRRSREREGRGGQGREGEGEGEEREQEIITTQE